MKRLARTVRLMPPLLCGGLASCAAPDPLQVIEVRDIETYWAVEPSVGTTHYLAPLVRFRVHNKSPRTLSSIQATAVFRRKGEEAQTWGTAWQQVAQSKRPLAVGAEALVELKSDGRYYSTGAPSSMLDHRLFKDAGVQVFVRVGSSGWTKMAEADIERRIGARSVQGLLQ